MSQKNNFKENRITNLLDIKYPIIQAGMVWVSGAKLAAASSNAGILGVIGAGSMNLTLLKEQIIKAKSLSKFPNNIAINIPLLYKDARSQIDLALEYGITKFITSAGSPKLYTSFLKDNKALVIHVTSTPELARKCEDAGVDAIVAEGFEAGGHNGRDEITTMCLIPQVRNCVSIPIIAAGGISSGMSMAAALCLGADAVQIGTRFVNSIESSAHQNFKEAIIKARSGDTKLLMKNYVPVRLLKNKFSQEIEELEQGCADKDMIIKHLGKGRAKMGMLEGDLEDGELEIGQCSALVTNILSTKDIVEEIMNEYSLTISKLA